MLAANAKLRSESKGTSCAARHRFGPPRGFRWRRRCRRTDRRHAIDDEKVLEIVMRSDGVPLFAEESDGDGPPGSFVVI